MKLKVEKFGSFVKIIWMFELNWRRKSPYLLLLLDIIRNVCFHWCVPSVTLRIERICGISYLD